MREHPTRDPFVPVVRCAADLLAVVPHTLGYWPADSLVLFAAGAAAAGACVRVDLPQDPSDGPFAEAFVDELAEPVGHDALSDRVFVIVYTDPPPRQERAVPPRVRGVLELVDRAAGRAGRRTAARWIVAGEQWWPVDDPSDVQDVAVIQDSAVNAALVAAGSSYAAAPRQAMDHEYGDLPAGTVRDVAGAAARWLRHGAGAWHHLDRLARSLGAWHLVLRLVGDARQEWVAALLGLDDDLLGFLAAGLADPVLADLLLAAGATGDVDGVLSAAALWGGLCDEAREDAQAPGGEDPGGEPTGPTLAPTPAGVPPVPPGPGGGPLGARPRTEPGAGELILLTRVLAGEWDGTPDWARLDALYRVLLALTWLLGPAHAVRARRDTGAGVPPQAVPTARTERARERAALAGVLVELAQLNRFRARGSHTAHFVRRATALVPGHPAALRVLRLADARPVPVWARDRSTAWHA
ncbi:DUF4192 family protein [Kocuria rosea]|uniref:DUF4192 family protein n=1 Tax=Kocuria rosea TaxID=1275 RepID=UPI00203A7E59|nr:DUF4192 family protein [Kocuria rosea]MCM3687292.1 DUF4192 domain-containing protein [Kocuria rosea]